MEFGVRIQFSLVLISGSPNALSASLDRISLRADTGVDLIIVLINVFDAGAERIFSSRLRRELRAATRLTHSKATTRSARAAKRR
jgi:hypothetical protein